MNGGKRPKRPLEMDELRGSVRSYPLNTIGGTMALPQTQHPNATRSRRIDRYHRSRLLLTLLLAFRWIVTSNRFLFAVAVVVVGALFALSFTTDAWHWFQRSGALLVNIGAIVPRFSSKIAQMLSMFAGGAVAQAALTTIQSTPSNTEPARKGATPFLTEFFDNSCMPLKALMI